MKFTHRCNDETIDILVFGDVSEISRCARIMLNVTEGYKSQSILAQSKISVKKLSALDSPRTLNIGHHKKETLTYSKDFIQFSYVHQDSNLAAKRAALNHYNVILDGINELLERQTEEPDNKYLNYSDYRFQF